MGKARQGEGAPGGGRADQPQARGAGQARKSLAKAGVGRGGARGRGRRRRGRGRVLRGIPGGRCACPTSHRDRCRGFPAGG
ncbi:MAG: hypothetical protein EOM72_11460 [Opitutae bacterium]|nr:hypothetical protein [Opitutae bacterium]